jgi:hypothetical protein
MNYTSLQVCLAAMFFISFGSLSCGGDSMQPAVKNKIPVVVITDLYHPYQDPGDNLDLISGYALSEFDLKAVIMDITNAFRKPVADHPTLWKDPRGPREAGMIPIMQLNYIFDRNVPWAIGPMSPMKSESDQMTSIPAFEQRAIELLLGILKESPVPIEILSFGSGRVLAVAYNRAPDMMKMKVAKIYLSAGTACANYKLGTDQGANMTPGGEWNVALDVFAFTRLLRSNLPIALFPCAGVDGAFMKDRNNTYWQMPDMSFVHKMDSRLQRYIHYAFTSQLRHDFLCAMDSGNPAEGDLKKYPAPFHMWETPIWIVAARREIVYRENGTYEIIPKSNVVSTDRIITNLVRPCSLTVRDDGRFLFEYTDQPTSLSIFVRDNPAEHEKALREAFPRMLQSYKTPNPN